ncbi:MAG: hypothetical protein JXA30_07155 [Deltaproteobacteria bacterium]|nr:hypothetical protein [Deltaproteobacteria bacterium]
MHLKVNRVHNKGKSYEYVRLVQSIRGPDGRPTHKVLATLGAMEPQMIANLRLALESGRSGKPVVLCEQEQTTRRVPVPTTANLAYLNIMALLDMWNRWELPDLLQRVVKREQDEVSAEHVLAALTIHRAVDPGSKLSSISWFSQTCLPEFQGVVPAQFNNSRVHRVLDALEGSLAELQKNLPLLYLEHKGKPKALFLDVTDTYFEGRGCEMAQRNRTKEGLRNRRKVGIVMLCDERGFPLQWEVVPGKRNDQQCMSEMLGKFEESFWVGEAPVVCDRAMGKASGVDRLIRSGLRFLTAIPRPEMDSYEVEIPAGLFKQLEPQSELDPAEADELGADLEEVYKRFERDVDRAREVAKTAGLERVDGTLYVKDLGYSNRAKSDNEIAWVSAEDADPTQLVGAASMVAWARIFRRVLDCGQVKSRAEIAQQTGVSRARVTELMNLLELDEALQDKLIAGDYGPITEHQLREVVKYQSAKKQQSELELLAERNEQQPSYGISRLRAKKLRVTYTEPVRCVVYFNPEMFVRQRLRERKHEQKLCEFIEELNRRLSSPYSRMDEHAVRFEVTQYLTQLDQLSLYELGISEEIEDERKSYQVKLTRNDEQWHKRRKYDGFVLLVAHQQVRQSAAELAYRREPGSTFHSIGVEHKTSLDSPRTRLK